MPVKEKFITSCCNKINKNLSGQIKGKTFDAYPGRKSHTLYPPNSHFLKGRFSRMNFFQVYLDGH